MEISGRTLGSAGGIGRRLLWISWYWVVIVPAMADVNSWTKLTSGYWEEQAFWSLGVLPNATQDVDFTNSGWKALVIGTNASHSLPQSMSVQSLRMSSPADSSNTLLLNFSGLTQPLRAQSVA